MAILRRTPGETGILNPKTARYPTKTAPMGFDRGTPYMDPIARERIEQSVSDAKSGIIRRMPSPPSNSASVPKETVNLGGQQPVRNPYTNGFETVNPTVQANTGIYSPEQKAQAVKDLGYQLKPGQENVGFDAIRDAFYRKEGGIGVKEDMLAPYFTKGNAAQELIDGAGKQIEEQKQRDLQAMEEGKLLTGQQQQTQPGGFAEFSSGITSQAGQFFDDTGISKQITSLETEKKRMESMLADGTLSPAERDRIQAIYNSANVALEVARDANLRQLQIGQGQQANEYDVAIQRQLDTNMRLLENAQKMAALTGASFSTGGMTGLGSIIQQGQSQINDLQMKKTGMMASYQVKMDETIKTYQADVMKNDAEMNKAIADKYSDTQAAINKIDAEIGKTTNEGIKQLREVAKDYLDFIDKEARRTMEKDKFAFDKVKFDTEQTFKEEKEQRDYYKGIFDSAFKEGNLYGIPASQIDSLDMPEEMKIMLKGGIVRDTINAMNELGESAGMTDIGTRYAEQIRSGIAQGFSSADIVASLSDQLNIPLTKPKDGASGKPVLHNAGNGIFVEQFPDGTRRVFDAKKEIEKISSSGLLSGLGNGKITGYGGAYDGFKGLDVDGKIGDPVMGISGKIVSVIDANYQSSPYGNSVVIEDADGNQIRISHLDSLNVQPGQSISATDLIGTLGNTGNVVAGPGGDGSHLDIRVKKAGTSEEMSSKEVEQFLKTYGKGASTQEGGVIGALGVPISYERMIKNQVPTQLQNSDGDREELNKNITLLHEAGQSPDEAFLSYMGVRLKDPKEQAYANQLIQSTRGLGEALPDGFYKTLVQYINQGDKNGAEAYVNRIADPIIKKVEGDNFVSTSARNFSNENARKISELIDANVSKVGIVNAKLSNLENKLAGDPDYQALKSMMTAYVARLRKDLAGSAVTATELEALADFIDLKTDTPVSSLKAKLQTISSLIDNQYAEQRRTYGIDELGKNQNMISDDAISVFLSGTPAQSAGTSGFINPFE